MNNLLLLIKALSAVFYAHRLGDRDVINEIAQLAKDIPDLKDSLVVTDKVTLRLIQETIEWVTGQDPEGNDITSVFKHKVADIVAVSPDLSESFRLLFDDLPEPAMRQVIFQNVTDIRKHLAEDKISRKLKDIMRPVLFNGERSLPEGDWLKLAEVVENKLASYQGTDKAVIERVMSSDASAAVKLLERYKLHTSPEGVYKLGMEGMNLSLYPDLGLRRGMSYLINAVTNSGKSFILSHMLASFPLYNKPLLLDSTKIPTVFFCSAEEGLGVVLTKLYNIFKVVETGEGSESKHATAQEMVDFIMSVFQENGWAFEFYRVDPSYENINELKRRVRNLEMRGHEIIVSAYDYLGMMTLEGCYGDSHTNKLQDLFRQARNFFAARDTISLSPHQLNPKAKEMLRECDDEGKLNFVRAVGGQSMTEGSTKITNEMDYVFEVNVAKLTNGEVWFTWFLGKVRSPEESASLEDRYGAYKLDTRKNGKPGKGLVHDIHASTPGFVRRVVLDKMLMSELDDLD